LHFDRNSGILDSEELEHTSAMSLIMLSATGAFVFLGIAFIVLFRKLWSGGQKPALPADWDSIYLASRYKPMERLLDPMDFRFLESQTCYSRGMARRLRANRISIFRGYSRCLARDFSRVSNALKMLMVHAPVDRSALAGLLLKQRLLFTGNMMSLEAQLMLHGLGWSAPRVDVRSLVEALDAMRTQLRVLAATAQPSASAA
jgi:hypothetical protein